MVTNDLDIKYAKEASEKLNVSMPDLKKFTDFIVKLEHKDLYKLLNSSGTTITPNIGSVLYNIHFHRIILISNDIGGVGRLSEDEITNLVGYINRIAERVNSINQEKTSEVIIKSEEDVKEVETQIENEEKVEILDGEEAQEVVDKKISPEVASWIERGQKILPEDKKEKWAEYVKENANTSFIGVGFDDILELMEKIGSLSDLEEVDNLIVKSNYTILGYDTIRNVIKEFFDIEIDKSYKLRNKTTEWIERGSKIVSDEKKEAWADYVRKNVEQSFLLFDFDEVLEVMEKAASTSDISDIQNLFNGNNYSIYMKGIFKHVIKEFLGIDIDKDKEEKKLSFEEKLGEQLEKIKKAREEAVEGKEVGIGVHGKEYIIEPTINIEDEIETDGMDEAQKEKVNALNELIRRKQAKEIELEKANQELFVIKGQYAKLNTLYRAAIYGTKDRVSTQITGEQSSINYYEKKAAKMARIAKKDRNRRLLNIFVNPGDSFAELSEEEKEKGFFGRIAAMWEHEQQDYRKELKDIESDTANKTQEFKKRISEYNTEIETTRKKLGKLGRSITDKSEEINNLKYELYEITQELTKLRQELGLNQEDDHDLKSDGQDR